MTWVSWCPSRSITTNFLINVAPLSSVVIVSANRVHIHCVYLQMIRAGVSWDEFDRCWFCWRILGFLLPDIFCFLHPPWIMHGLSSPPGNLPSYKPLLDLFCPTSHLCLHLPLPTCLLGGSEALTFSQENMANHKLNAQWPLIVRCCAWGTHHESCLILAVEICSRPFRISMSHDRVTWPVALEYMQWIFPCL